MRWPTSARRRCWGSSSTGRSERQECHVSILITCDHTMSHPVDGPLTTVESHATLAPSIQNNASSARPLASQAVDLSKILDRGWRFRGCSVGPPAHEEQRGGADFITCGYRVKGMMVHGPLFGRCCSAHCTTPGGCKHETFSPHVRDRRDARRRDTVRLCRAHPASGDREGDRRRLAGEGCPADGRRREGEDRRESCGRHACPADGCAPGAHREADGRHAQRLAAQRLARQGLALSDQLGEHLRRQPDGGRLVLAEAGRDAGADARRELHRLGRRPRLHRQAARGCQVARRHALHSGGCALHALDARESQAGAAGLALYRPDDQGLHRLQPGQGRGHHRHQSDRPSDDRIHA